MKKIEFDVAVVALGPAGLAAAVQAAEEGLTVVAFEKANIAGGTANIAVGPFAVESKLQKKNMIDLTKEEALRIHMDYTHWQVDARLVREYFWKSADTIDWLMDMGVEFEVPCKYYPHSYATWHRVKPEGGGPAGARTAATMNKILYERALELGVEAYLETPVIKILKEGSKVTGVIAKDKNGEEIWADCKAVIIATGGFGDSPEMIKEYTGYTYGEDMFNFRVPGLVGDGLKMAWEVGAGKSNMTMESFVGTSLPHPECVAVNVLALQPNLIVNLQGERFFDEGFIEIPSEACNAVRRQDKRKAFVIFGESILKEYKREGVDFPFTVRPEDHTRTFDEQLVIALEQCPHLVAVSDKLEDIAANFGINLETLKTTVEEYNRSCVVKYDDLFGKKRRYMRPVTGKLYAVQLSGRAYGSLGGIRINYKTEVLTEDNKVIPGLYAAGADVADLYAGTYLYLLPGNTMGFALNSGRIAAERAAEYIGESE
jgi:fumarate reductase flavoprotein subunit